MSLLLTVTELNRSIKILLESTLEQVAVSGEISNLAMPTSGHCYFTLKDATAQVKCVFFKQYQRDMGMRLQNGMQVVINGQLSLYEARGDYQLLVRSIVPAGVGALAQQFEALKIRLSEAGLFDVAHKKPLPAFPKAIGVVTSPNTAALRDVLITLYRRYPLATVKLYPSEVQGRTAAAQLCQAIQVAHQEQVVDVLIIARGGGSLEDLWAFNDEALAYEIFHTTIPCVTGIGHETDFTIADFVADWRAATPTAAVVAATPDQQAIRAHLMHTEKRLANRLTESCARLQQRFEHLKWRLQAQHPFVMKHVQTVDHLERRLRQLCDHYLQSQSQALSLRCRALSALSPLDTLGRGFSVAMQGSHVLTDVSAVDPTLPIQLILSKGQLTCQVVKCVSEQAIPQ